MIYISHKQQKYQVAAQCIWSKVKCEYTVHIVYIRSQKWIWHSLRQTIGLDREVFNHRDKLNSTCSAAKLQIGCGTQREWVYMHGHFTSIAMHYRNLVFQQKCYVKFSMRIAISLSKQKRWQNALSRFLEQSHVLGCGIAKRRLPCTFIVHVHAWLVWIMRA